MKLDWLLLQGPKDFRKRYCMAKITSHLSCVKRLGLRNNRRVSGAESCGYSPGVFFVIYNSTLGPGVSWGFLTLQSYATFFITKMMGIPAIYYWGNRCLKLQNAQGSNEKDSMIHTFFGGWYKTDTLNQRYWYSQVHTFCNKKISGKKRQMHYKMHQHASRTMDVPCARRSLLCLEFPSSILLPRHC